MNWIPWVAFAILILAIIGMTETESKDSRRA